MRAVRPVRAVLSTDDALTRFVLRHADRCLVLSHRLQECVTHAPQLEEEMALANIALDLLGQARALYTFAAGRVGDGLTEDDLAYMRDADEFDNPSLVEQPNGDFADVIVRQLLHDLWAIEFWTPMSACSDEFLAGVAAKAVKETSYHLRHATQWVIVLGDSTDEAHVRTQAALDRLWPHTDQLFVDDSIAAVLAPAGVPSPSTLRAVWLDRVDTVLRSATLGRPEPATAPGALASNAHAPSFGVMIEEMQELHRAFQGARW